jgi:hypothetical protein
VPAGQLGECGAQRSQFVFDDGADEVVVDLEVAVHQDVVHTDELSPRQVRLLIASVLRQPTGRLADDLEMSDDPPWMSSSLSKTDRPRWVCRSMRSMASRMS